MPVNRTLALGSVSIKSIKEDERVIEGIASTPSVDRVGDIVEPAGAVFKLPLPLMLDHDHRLVVGKVEWAEVTKAGIRFRARIAKIVDPGAAKDLVDMAWAFVKASLRDCVSIGFRPIEHARIEGGGVRFISWEWYELSLVGVPANAEALITGRKSALGARQQLARAGSTGQPRVVRLGPAACIRGQIAVAADRRAAARARLGIPNPVVNLSAEHMVEGMLAIERQHRRGASRKLGRVVKL